MRENLMLQSEADQGLQALLPQLRGQVDCVYIDPPFGTGETIEAGPRVSYDDRLDGERWLEMMRPLLPLLHDLLAPHGSLFVHLNDTHLDYLKVAADEVFGRQNFLNRITVAARSPSSFSTVNPGVYKASEYLLWYARDRSEVRRFPQRVPRPPDRAYGMFLENPDDPWSEWRFTTVRRACPAGTDRDRFQVERARQICRLATISDKKAGRATLEAKLRSKATPDRVIRVDRPGQAPQYLLRGQQLIFYDRQVTRIDGALTASRPMTDIWTDLSWEGIAGEGGVTFRKGKKPERLIRRCLQLATLPGDLVLDCFLGSGTTAAAAHKMERRWIGVERGAHINLAAERLERVCAGADRSGITKLEGWTGGGTFRRLSLEALDTAGATSTNADPR